jgi:hypothetical protein
MAPQRFQPIGPRGDEIGVLLALLMGLAVAMRGLRNVITEHLDDVETTRAIEVADAAIEMVTKEITPQ